MKDTAGNDLEVKTSGVANDAALSERDDIVISDLSSSTLTDVRSSGPGNQTSFEQLGTGELDADMAHTSEEMPTRLETPEPEKPGKNVKFNLRKSLAWDSAFFTSDGVLDAEELSTMIEGGEKGVKNQLPGIEEEVYRSMESISTLESDNLTLECLEAELFEDIRASIQKSSRISNLNNSSIKVSSAMRDSQAKVSSSSKKMDLDSEKRLAARIKDNNTSSIPQPKIVNRMNSTSTLTKRASLSTNQTKKDQDIVKKAQVTQKGTLPAKTTTQGSKIASVIGPRRGVPKPSLSSKSFLGSSTAPKTEPTRPSSSCSNSSSSSGNDVKCSASFLRRKVDSKTGKLGAGSIPKTPSKISVKNKAPPANSRISSNFSNLPSDISPASSISEWSSESSSSTSTINRKSTSRGSIDTSASQRSLDCDASIESVLTIHPTGRNSNQNGNQTVVPPSQTASLSRPPVVQPTGLRMPSPKIGFFDGGKSVVRTPNGGMRSQSRVPTAVPRTGAKHSSPTTSDAANFGKLPPSKTTAAHTNMNPNPLKPTPKPFQEQPSTKPKLSTTSRGVKTSLVTSHHKSEISRQGSEEFKIASAEDSVSEPSLNIFMNSSQIVDNDSNIQSHSVNKSLSKMEIPSIISSEAGSNECFVAVKDNKLDNTIADSSRTPFALKNSVSDTIEAGKEVAERSVNFLYMESQQKENSDII